MKCVGEHDITHEIMAGAIVNVERGIELKIARQVARKTDGR